MKTLKKYSILMAMALFAAGCNNQSPATVINYPPQQNQQSAITPTSDWQTYSYLPYNFEFKYPTDFAFTQPVDYNNSVGTPIVSLVTAKNNYPGTNYDESIFSITAGYVKDLKTCLTPVQNPVENSEFKETQDFNGVTFYKARADGAAAGNIYHSEVYRTLNKGICLEVDLTVHTGNIGNYPDGSHIIELDQSKPLGVMEQMLATFKFTK